MRLPLSLLAATLLLSGCMVAQGYTEKEQSIVDSLDGGQYQPASRQSRDNIETQSLLAQATFWSREAQLNPADLEAAIRLTSAVRKMGNASQAVDIAQMARQMHPRDPYLLAEYAASLIADERGSEAIKPLQEGLRTTPAYGRLWSLMGASLDQQEKYAQARRHYERALQITPNDSNVLANMGLSFALEGNAQIAEKWLRRAAAQPGASPGVTQNLDLVLQLQGKSPENKMAAAAPQKPQFAQQPTWSRAAVQGPTTQNSGNPNSRFQGQMQPQARQPQMRQPQAVTGQSMQGQSMLGQSMQGQAMHGTMSNGRSFSVGKGAPRSASDAARMAARQGQSRKATVPMGQAVPRSTMLPQNGAAHGNMQQQQQRAMPQNQMPQGYGPQTQPQGYAPQQPPQGPGYAPQYGAQPPQQQVQPRGAARRR